MHNTGRVKRDWQYEYHPKKSNAGSNTRRKKQKQAQHESNEPVPSCSFDLAVEMPDAEKETPEEMNRMEAESEGTSTQCHAKVNSEASEEVTDQACDTDEANEDMSGTIINDGGANTEDLAQTADAIELEPHISYAIELARWKSLVCVSPDLTVFLLQDIAQKTLAPMKYLLLQRRKIRFRGDLRWVYMCPCNKARKDFAQGLSTLQLEPYEEVFTDGYEECIHIKALDYFMKTNEPEVLTNQDAEADGDQVSPGDHTYAADARLEWQVYKVHGRASTLCVQARDGSYGVVYIRDSVPKNESKLRCLNCENHPCRHVNEVHALLVGLDEDPLELQELAEDIRKELNMKQKYRKQHVPTSQSTQKIPLYVCGKVCPAKSLLEKENRLAAPRCLTCPLCSGLMKYDAQQSDVKLYTEKEVYSAKVYIHQCLEEDCAHKVHYDGREDHILNMGSHLIGHDVLRAYLRLFVTEGLTMYSYYKTWFWTLLEHSGETPTVSIGTFRYAWYSFIDLLDVQYSEAFMCPSCTDEPPCLIMDGITLGFQNIHLPWEVFLGTHVKPPTSLQGTSHNVRVFVNNKDARQLLRTYSDAKDPKFLNREEFNRLLKLMSLYQPAMTDFLEDCREHGYTRKAPAMSRRLVYALASNSPVTALFNDLDTVETLTEDLCNLDLARNSFIMRSMQEHFPAMYSLIAKTGLPLPQIFRPIVLEIQAKCRATLIPKHKLPTAEEGDEHMLTFFPNNKVKSVRGTYVQDQTTVKQELTSSCDKLRQQRRTGHKTLLPGLFTMNCKHGVTYGFQVMTNVESPNVPFTLLRTRFTKGPKLIVYDNACNLHQYCLNRDTGFFEDTKFAVDRLHWKNHKGCSEGYNLSNFPQFDKINSQVAEQRNSALVKLKPMLSYMNAKNFMTHLTLFSYFRNMLALSQLHVSVDVKYMDMFRALSKVYCKQNTGK